MTPPPPRLPDRPPPRTLWRDLRGLDQSILPRVARWIGRMRSGARDLGPTIDRGRGGAAATLERLDRRFARRGVLGLVHDVPQAGAFALAALITAAAVLVLVRQGPAATAGPVDELPAVVGAQSVTVGPFAVDTAGSYLLEARARLVTRTTTAPNEPVYAIADFDAPVTPGEATTALPGVVPALVFMHVPGPPSSRCEPTHPRVVSSLPGGASVEFTKLAGCLESEAADLTRQARTTVGDPAARASYLRDAGRERASARSLRAACACIIAVVVRAAPDQLTRIADSGTVRVIDPAEPGQALTDICWIPLYGHKSPAAQQLCPAAGP